MVLEDEIEEQISTAERLVLDSNGNVVDEAEFYNRLRDEEYVSVRTNGGVLQVEQEEVPEDGVDLSLSLCLICVHEKIHPSEAFSDFYADAIAQRSTAEDGSQQVFRVVDDDELEGEFIKVRIDDGEYMLINATDGTPLREITNLRDGHILLDTGCEKVDPSEVESLKAA